MRELKRQVNKDEIHPKHVFTPTQASPFLGCLPRNVKNLIQPAWYDGNIPKFLGEDIIAYQESRRRQTFAVQNQHRDILQNLR